MPPTAAAAPTPRPPAPRGASIRITPERDGAFGRVWVLRAEQVLDHPPERVFPFFADAHNLEAITPGFLRFRVLTPRPIAMRSGLVLDYRLRIHGLGVRWRTEIQGWDPPRAFTDTQLRGPYALWRHTHTFEPVDGGRRTLCRDEVRFRPRGGPLAGVICRLFVVRDVEAIFRYRAQKLAEIFA